jgi:hypothetical protein
MLIVEKLLQKYYHSCEESKVETFSMLYNFFRYYKIQHGGKNPMLMNKVVIVFIMEIMHK